MPLDRVTILCFEASYALALAFEIARLARPGRLVRTLAIAWGGAGLLAQTLYLVFHPPALSSQPGPALLLTWVLAVFYVYGALHHSAAAWGLFVLPLVLVLVELARRGAGGAPSSWALPPDWFGEPALWRVLHYGLILLASVGVSVGCIASVMYLVQAQRLKAKALPREGLQLLSLERLEAMNRRAVNLAFPLLTAGAFIGFVLAARAPEAGHGLADFKVVGTTCLWALFAVLLWLRYGVHVRGRSLALLTIAAFVLLLGTFASAHTSAPGGRP